MGQNPTTTMDERRDLAADTCASGASGGASGFSGSSICTNTVLTHLDALLLHIERKYRGVALGALPFI